MYQELITIDTKKNHVSGGTIYMPPMLNPAKLQFQMTNATSFQAKAFDADMRLTLNTTDGSSKKDLLLEIESMPVPVSFSQDNTALMESSSRTQ